MRGGQISLGHDSNGIGLQIQMHMSWIRNIKNLTGNP